MSIAVGLVGYDSIVLATDSRVTLETRDKSEIQHCDNAIKLYKLSDYIGMAYVSNIQGYEEWIIDQFIRIPPKNGESIEETINRFAEFIIGDFGRYTKNPLLVDAYLGRIMEFIIAGFRVDGSPVLVRIPISVTEPIVVHNAGLFYVTGVHTIGRYWLKRLSQYTTQKLKTESLKRLAITVIHETITFQDSVGGDIQMVVIKKNKKIRFVSVEETKLIRDNLSKFVNTQMETIAKNIL